MSFLELNTAFIPRFMLVFRITSSRMQRFAGTGCLYAAGRWHYKGTQILYTSERIYRFANWRFLPTLQLFRKTKHW